MKIGHPLSNSISKSKIFQKRYLPISQPTRQSKYKLFASTPNRTHQTSQTSKHLGDTREEFAALL